MNVWWCCDNFRHAQILGSDHALLGAAIVAVGREWSIGNCANISHCPYCGKILTPPVEEDKT